MRWTKLFISKNSLPLSVTSSACHDPPRQLKHNISHIKDLRNTFIFLPGENVTRYIVNPSKHIQKYVDGHEVTSQTRGPIKSVELHLPSAADLMSDCGMQEPFRVE